MKKLKIVNNSSWYEEGLHFECTGCGRCCTGSPGYVWVNDEEIQEMASYLKLTKKEFIQRYTRLVNGRLSLVELKKNYDCIFLKESKCAIYPVRPTQCKTFPWWSQNLTSLEAWQEAAKWCEGISKRAPKVSSEIIEEERQKHEKALSKGSF